MEGRKSGYYTWMGLSNFIWLYLKNYWKVLPIKKSYKLEQITPEIMEPAA
jgi:hypothetical protein